MSFTLAAILLFIFLGAVAQGTAGVGLGLVATPFIAALDPMLVPGPMLVVMVFAASWTAWRDRAEVDRGWAAAALAGRVPGAILGAWLFAAVTLKVYAWIFAASVVAGVVLSLMAPKTRPSLPGLAAGGFASGFMGTLTSIGGPPIILAIQHGAPPRVRATLSLFFAVGSLMSVGALMAFGRFDWNELLLGLAVTPPMALGILASKYLKGRIDRGAMRPLLLGLAAFAAPLLIFRAFVAG
jgi:uncharacterized membrane protein YfcA